MIRILKLTVCCESVYFRVTRSYRTNSTHSTICFAYGARSCRSHYDVILIVTSFDTELFTPTVTEERTYVTGTLPRLTYKDVPERYTIKTTTGARRSIYKMNVKLWRSLCVGRLANVGKTRIQTR